MFRRLVPFTCLVLAVSAPAEAGQTPRDLPAAIASIVARHLEAPGPGAVVAVVHRGETVVLHASGLANLDYGLPLTADSRFYLGSLAKQFTAASIALLVEDGRISLDDPIGKYVANLPPVAARIPLHQLMHHRSGIRDYLKIRDLNGERDEPFDNPEALAIVRRQRSLVFSPGGRYQYSNSNYILLAEVVRAVSGQSLAAFAAARLFAPAGMPATFFETDAASVVPDRVVSYSRDGENGWHRHVKQFEAVGDGGAYSSMRDLLRWDAIIRSRSVLSDVVFKVLLTPPADVLTPYAGGFLIRPFLGQAAIEHSGFMFGFQHHYLRFPDHDLAILILTNRRDIESFELREQIVRAAFEKLTTAALVASAPPQARPAVTPSEGPMPPLDPAIGGTFSNAEIPLEVRMWVEKGTLHIHPATFRAVPLTRLGVSHFTGIGGEIEVLLGETPDAWTLRVRDMGDFVFTRIAAG